MIFSLHPSFSKELKKFLKKHHQNDGWLFHLQNLLTAHFEKKTIRLPEKKLAQIGKVNDYELWKVLMVIGGIRKNQCPKVCFSKIDSEIIFLCFGTHIENYKTSELIFKGKKRLKEMVEINPIKLN